MARQPSADGLSPRQRRFVEEYLIDLNGQAAAIRAGYAAHTARITASRLLTKANIQAAIADAQAVRGQRTQITQDAVLHEIGLLQHSDVTHYYVDDAGNLQLTPSAPHDAMRAVSGYRKKIIPTEHGFVYEVEIKLWNKPASLKMGGDHLGLFREQGVESADIQAMQQGRAATVRTLRQRLSEIAQRHRQSQAPGGGE